MGLKLQFVGCGDAFGSGGRFNTCFHLTGDTTNLLIDCGASSLIALKKLGIDRNAIDGIAFTHFHADHFGGVPFFVLDAQFTTRRTRPLVITGPPGLARWYERVMETAFPGSAAIRPKFDLELREVAPGETARIADALIRPFQALHGPPGGPYHSVRIEADGRAVAYSGDTEWCEGLLDAAREADLFVAEAYFFDKKIVTHLSLADLEAHMAEIRPRRLVLTHMSDDMLGRLGSLPYETAEDGKVVEIG